MCIATSKNQVPKVPKVPKLIFSKLPPASPEPSSVSSCRNASSCIISWAFRSRIRGDRRSTWRCSWSSSHQLSG